MDSVQCVNTVRLLWLVLGVRIKKNVSMRRIFHAMVNRSRQRRLPCLHWKAQIWCDQLARQRRLERCVKAGQKSFNCLEFSPHTHTFSITVFYFFFTLDLLSTISSVIPSSPCHCTGSYFHLQH